MMKCMLLAAVPISFCSLAGAAEGLGCASGKAPFAIAIHGGLGETQYSSEVQSKRRALILDVLRDAQHSLAAGARAIDAVSSSRARLEGSGLFNAGKGAVSNSAGEVTLDASIMDGLDRTTGAVANFKSVKNPILAARLALSAGNRFFVGPDGENFAANIEHVPKSYFVHVEERPQPKPTQSGTIGAVVLDRCGNLAAGTSTGGYNEKPVGRVGDSPIIGAATFAANGVVAISTTGEGEYFIRTSAAHDLYAQMKYGKKSVEAAAKDVIVNQVAKLGGQGGVIALDAKGHFAVVFRKSQGGLLRGIAKKNDIKVGVFESMESVK